ncbi:MAG: T9SS type A sorting domain-containing protein [Bacteroidota bacterium]|nr:T9SS type A sorting domain-containing protein [Bacteroidota bacterium]
MNKKILILSLLVPFWAYSQKSVTSKLNGNSQQISEETTVSKTTVSKDFKIDSTIKTNPKPINNQFQNFKRNASSYSFVDMGTTFYDLQTNASMGNRINLLPGGKVSVAWTTASDQSFTSRGTGYNHYNGSTWFTPVNPTPRLENTRLGWPSIGLNGNKEWVMAHSAADGGFVLSYNAGIGSQTWSSSSLVLSQPQKRPIWGRIMNSGDIFHCIASYADSSLPGEPRAPYINGVYAPLTYSRSLDGGVTWDKIHTVFDGYDSTRIISGGGDIYAIDVRDSIVAIVTGRLLHDVSVFKSTDNGNTFTKMLADSFKYAPYNAKKLMTDTPFVCDGSLDVLIDNNGNVHAFWGVSRVFDDDTTNELYSFFPGTSLLGYWNEVNKISTFIAGGSQFDRNGNGTYEFSAGNTQSLDATGRIPQALKNAGISGVARLGNTGVIHMPSAGIDAAGNIYVSFSAPLEQDVDVNNINLRDIMLVHSTDGGNTWSTPQDITQKQGQEEEFASVARKVDDFVHIVFQMDDYAGTNLQSNDAADNNHPVAQNKIMYVAVPTAKILDGSIGQLWDGVNVKNVNANKEVFIVSQNQPNPFSSLSEVIIWLNEETNLTVEITNINGQVIKTNNLGQMNAGNHSLTLDANGLSAGIYFYTIKTATHSVTRKMSVN